MRIVIIVILASIVTSMLYAQIDPPLYAPEFYIHAKNGTPNTTIHFTLEKISVGYCYDADIVPNQFVECDECLPYCSSCEGSTIEVEINASGNNASGQEGWGFCAFEIATKDPPHYGFAVYKLTQVESQNYIYLDTRDIRYSRGLLLGGYDVDFIIRYDGSGDGEFEFDAYTDGTWTTIPMKGLQQIWRGDWDGDGDIDYSFPDVSLFPTDFWSNCLIIGFPPEYIAAPFSLQLIWSKNPNQDNISKYYLHRQIDAGGFIKIGEFNNQTFDYKDKSILFTGDGSSTVSYKVTSFNGIESTPTNLVTEDYLINFVWNNGLILTKNGNHPKLVWVPNNTIQNLTGYKIYRKVEDEPFYYMGMVGTNIFTYTDGEVNLNVKESAIQYYVVATNGAHEDPTNTVTAIGDYNPHKENQTDQELSALKFSLSDNYPNPFNPNTSISYSIPENAFVTLKIYDVLGNEVEVLINEQKESGNYQIDFNASELSSGIYYYTLTAGIITSTKKMSLIK